MDTTLVVTTGLCVQLSAESPCKQIISSPEYSPGTYLMVQWLMTQLPTQEARVQSLVRELIPHATTENLHAAMTKNQQTK